MNDLSFLESSARGEGCLSDFAISRFVMGFSKESSVADHIKGCEHCAARVREENASFGAAQMERVPAALRDAFGGEEKDKAKIFDNFGSVVGVLAALACLVIFVGVPREEGIREKGAAEPLRFSLLRSGQLLHARETMRAILPLQKGDRVQVHFQAPVPYAVLEALDGSKYVRLFAGEIGGRDIPTALLVDDVSGDKIRVASCTLKYHGDFHALEEAKECSTYNVSF